MEWRGQFIPSELAILEDQAFNGIGPQQAMAQAMLANQPVLSLDEQVYWRAFHSLWSERPQGMNGLGAIPFSAMITYANEYEMDREERDEFFRIIRMMDATHLMIQAKHQEREAKRNK